MNLRAQPNLHKFWSVKSLCCKKYESESSDWGSCSVPILYLIWLNIWFLQDRSSNIEMMDSKIMQGLLRARQSQVPPCVPIQFPREPKYLSFIWSISFTLELSFPLFYSIWVPVLQIKQVCFFETSACTGTGSTRQSPTWWTGCTNNQYLQHTQLPAFICLCHYWHKMPLHKVLCLLVDFRGCSAFPSLTENCKVWFSFSGKP